MASFLAAVAGAQAPGACLLAAGPRRHPAGATRSLRRLIPPAAGRTAPQRPSRRRGRPAVPRGAAWSGGRLDMQDALSSDDDPCSDAVSSWDDLRSMASIAYAMFAGAGDYESVARIIAAEKLGPEATYEILQPVGAVQRYSQAFDGTLFNCTTVIDMHYRLLKDCMIQDDYRLVGDVYANLAQVNPPLGDELLAATADVGAQALEYFKEEHEIVRAMLEDIVPGSTDEEAIREYQQAQAIVGAVDKCAARLAEVVST
mmetsp:Transcript_23312/g.58863  ORF Transcript_23312/g.58863 Transcript_23312/m.58863 type:complete len:258 (-) Transcript_23312:1534-2307(-)